MKKNENGVTIIALIVIIIVTIIIAGITVSASQRLIRETELKNIVTDMLLIQARAETIYDKNQFDESIILVGKKITDETANITDDEIQKYGIAEESKDKWFVWDETTDDTVEEELNNLGVKYRDAYYIINYEEGEIIYSSGYVNPDTNEKVYKLSELKDIKN